MRNARKLRDMIKANKLIMAPGAYDSITAFMIEHYNFPAVYVSGSGVSMSLLAHPDLNTVSYLELKTRVENIINTVDIPLIVDIDAGFGGPLNLIRLVREFERLGVAAIQIEDQQMPKRCGHELGRKIVNIEEMCKRIQTIIDFRNKEDGIVIIARTDARTSHGIEEAINRANIYLEHGADVIFVESPETLEEIQLISEKVNGPILFNNVEGGRSPFLTKEELESFEFNIVIYPNSLMRRMVKSGQQLLETLNKFGTTQSSKIDMLDHKELFQFFKHDEWVSLEEKYISKQKMT